MKKALLAACALLAMAGTARGEVVHHGDVQGWTISALSQETEKLCVAEKGYPGNYKLGFSLTQGGDIASINVMNEKWDIPKANYTVRSWVDDGKPSEFGAVSLGSLLMVRYDLNETAFRVLTSGSRVFFEIGAERLQFDLQGTALMFPELIKCAMALGSASNPFGGQTQQPAAPVSTPSNPFRRT
jgi:hypothetical protein